MKNRPQDTDADFDPVRSLCEETFQQPFSSPGGPAPAPSPRRDGRDRLTASRASGRSAGEDSLRGLANYFVRNCPPLSWDTSLELGNYKALVALMSTLRRDLEMTPAQIRTLIDVYFVDLKGRRPKRAYLWDFKGSYHRLLARIEAAGLNTTGADYESWTASPVTDAEMQAAAQAAIAAARARQEV
jgi:hypothetical protein